MLKTPLKILFLARWYPDRYDPMMGLFIKRHAEVAAGFADVAVLYLRAAPECAFGFEIIQSVENKVDTTIVHFGTNSNLHPRLAKLLSGFMFLMAFCKGYCKIVKTWGKPGIIHVNVLTRLGLFALWLHFFRGIKYVITEHWSRYLPITNTYKGVLRKVLTKLVVKNAGAVSTVSENLALAMQSHGLKNKHYMVLPNVVDTDEYTISVVISPGIKKRFIHISCFEDRSKNISGLLSCVSELAKQRSDFECIMVGEGIDLEKMKSLAAHLGLKHPQIQFTGLLENQQVVDAYHSTSFMVMFSNFENMPVVISESLACGLPVVATKVGGIPEYVTRDNGLLVDAGDEKALLNAINHMLDYSSEYDAIQIRAKSVAIFGKQAVAAKLQELYSFVNY